ncbi:hypothetical protein PAMP_010169 [Pampus punctatissimus]
MRHTRQATLKVKDNVPGKMVSKEGGKCMLTNSESDSEAAPLPSTSLALEVKYSLEASRQVRKRNKALQVRFKDICEAQNEQREAELQAAGKGGKPISYKVAYRKYMTVPARRSIPNVTRSTGVQTSPDLKKRYQTFPFERKKGHTFKHVAAVETYKGQDNGFVMEVKQSKAAEQGLDEEEEEEEGACGGSGVRRTRALLHTNECIATVEQHTAPDGLCSDALLLSCSADTDCLADTPGGSGAGAQAEYQLCSVPSKARTGLQHREVDTDRSAKRQLLNLEEGSSRTLPDRASKVTGPIAWNSLTQVECLDSPSVRSKRKKSLQLNGLQSETLPRASGCTTQAQCHTGQLSARPLRGMEEPLSPCGGEARGAPPDPTQEACKQIVPMNQDGDVKAQLQAMESLISSSQETIKVLLGVIQELEKGEAHREGVELDFKQQEDKLQSLMKRLCPTEDAHFAPLSYPQEAFTSTPKRKSKADSKKHARWKLWFL